MFGPSHPKSLHSLHVFSTKPPNSTTLTSMKIKTLIHTLIFSHLNRLARSFAKAKSILTGLLKENQTIQIMIPLKKKKNKNVFGSFRLHYNWCSSHVLPMPAPILEGLSGRHHFFYDSAWNKTVPTRDCEDKNESQLSGYLHWLEEKADENSKVEEEINEIDLLADLFIANCHEKFRLEKQESYRRFQEMMARSI
ncbi:Protein of unknown function DUF761, plant [Dillenia turbinata]|uniref:DUF761 domain-containing protein n=1 Tax=Dillenia turbinata TaxID=194707 RepID=A0AAN8WG94_9MAGN